MDNRRFILFVVLCFGVLVVSQWVITAIWPPPRRARPAPAAERPAAPARERAAAEAAAAAGSTPTATARLTPSSAPVSAPADFIEPPTRELERQLGRLRLRLDSRGARVRAVLPEGHRDFDGRSPLDLLAAFEQPASALALRLPGAPLALDAVGWELQEQGPALVFRRPVDAGLWVVKRLAPAGGYALEVSLEFENRGSEPRELAYALEVAGAIRPEEPTPRELVYGVAGVRGEGEIALRSEAASGLPRVGEQPPKRLGEPLAFGGVASKYFAMVLVPLEAGGGQAALELSRLEGRLRGGREGVEGASARAVYTVQGLRLEPGATLAHRYLWYAGPKSEEAVAPFAAHGLEKLIDLSSWIPFAESLSLVFLKLLHLFHGVLGSYGLAIIVLTLLVRGALHPLSKASQRSTMKMQKLAPLVNEIRERYKGKTSREELQQMNLEIMELYKRHGASPVAGCLPMLLQLPVFIGLYNGLAYSIELRQTEFLYIRDLSKPDRLLDLGTALPWPLEGYLNLLPILMVVMMVVQQSLMPKPPDPQQQAQQRLMKFMMVAFGVLFYTVPSGLVLYFLTSSAVGTLETRWIRTVLEREEAEAPRAAGAAQRAPATPPAAAPPPAKRPRPGSKGRRKKFA
ncbi:MAG: hypothetical protein KatS3mg102_2290 [Planctomycetota bacterium]|nr:MAG: hypothetical protein KatS3mg102_2290 [Planctomycetota bacterium]